MLEEKPYEKQAVRNLQKYLRQISYQYPEITSPPVDGIFESVTRQALIDFQLKKGLIPDGVADRATWDMLFNEYNASMSLHSPPEAINIFPRNVHDYKLKSGDSSVYVLSLQYMLRELHRDYGDKFDIELNGIYDQNTEEAVRHFQTTYGMFPDGEVDKITWDIITRAYNRRTHEYLQ